LFLCANAINILKTQAPGAGAGVDAAATDATGAIALSYSVKLKVCDQKRNNIGVLIVPLQLCFPSYPSLRALVHWGIAKNSKLLVFFPLLMNYVSLADLSELQNVPDSVISKLTNYNMTTNSCFKSSSSAQTGLRQTMLWKVKKTHF